MRALLERLRTSTDPIAFGLASPPPRPSFGTPCSSGDGSCPHKMRRPISELPGAACSPGLYNWDHWLHLSGGAEQGRDDAVADQTADCRVSKTLDPIGWSIKPEIQPQVVCAMHVCMQYARMYVCAHIYILCMKTCLRLFDTIMYMYVSCMLIVTEELLCVFRVVCLFTFLCVKQRRRVFMFTPTNNSYFKLYLQLYLHWHS